LELRPKKNDVAAISMAGDRAYQLHSADLWECPGCGIELLLGFGSRPITEHFDPEFEKVRAGYDVQFEYWTNGQDKPQ
jgi:hypothetical protein